MKKLLIAFVLCLSLFSCANRGDDVIVVEYPVSSGLELLSSSVFEDIEMVKLYEVLLPTWTRMVVKNNMYYIAAEDKVYLFDATGKYLNSVGEKGRGPAEYVSNDGIIVEDNGDISVYSNEGLLHTYAPEGRFLGNTEYCFSSKEFAKGNGFNYHYCGNGSGKPYQLYITDIHNRVVDSCIAASTAPSMFVGSVFSAYKDVINLCPPEGGDIYRLINGKARLSYKFNFGMYSLPAEYYQCNNMNEVLHNVLLSNTVAFKCMFLENQKYAVLEAIVYDAKYNSERTLYGILEKATSIWKWYYMNDGDFMDYCNLKYMDDSYLYFIAYPDLMKEPNIAEHFPALRTLSEDCTMVILKCKLAIN